MDLQAYLKQWQDEIQKKEESIKDLPRIDQVRPPYRNQNTKNSVIHFQTSTWWLSGVCVCVPVFPQTQFILLSKTLYGLFHGDPEEEALFRAVARVTSLLLRMEEVGRRLQEDSAPSRASSSPQSPSPSKTSASPPESTSPVEAAAQQLEAVHVDQDPSSPGQAASDGAPSSPEGTSDGASSSTLETEPANTPSEHTAPPSPQGLDWSFSFEQVLASLLNEPVLVRFFEKPVDIRNLLVRAKRDQLKAQINK